MAGVPEERGTKRKRVFRACDSCRSMKAKCDGIRPACGRCTGYGYKCVYAFVGKKGQKTKSSLAFHDDIKLCGGPAAALRLAISEYDRLVRDLLPHVPEPLGSSVLESLGPLNERVQEALKDAVASSRDTLPSRPLTSTTPAPKQDAATPTSRVPMRPAERYLGEVSDVRFFNLVDRALGENNPPEHGAEALESYEQDEPSPDEALPHTTVVEFPSAAAAERYLDIYFSTIHIAYPFIPRALFMSTYESYLATGKPEQPGNTWLATLYIIFAIGAYYNSVSGGTGDTLHEQYYYHALALSSAETLDRSMSEVKLLLAQCFYLLAVCRTDKCWTTLGLAVRIAQSIGLHVDAEESQAGRGPSWPKAEARRRVWYSVYVLDRLLALQLGRPPAIHDDDCHLQLPSRLGDADIDWHGNSRAPPPQPAHPTVGDYFVSMISLSKIIGFVLRDLYSPRCKRDITSWLPNTQSLDKQLLEWRQTLPRKLRFDFGHTFETSIAFKRQRNMLAIKFHHLRALVHRPYLCLPFLRRLDDESVVASLQRGDTAHLLDLYEKTCIAEAQETAHLLHNVVNKEDLVHDFPWWQMISCLICASSILVVASAFARRSAALAEGAKAVDVAALEDDAETCLKVFEALSPNSEGARIARDMMRRLKARGSVWREVSSSAHHHHVGSTNCGIQPTDVHHTFEAEKQLSGGEPYNEDSEMSSAALAVPIPGIPPAIYENGMPSLQEWPLEILDSMAWSTQFFEAVDGSIQSESYEL